LEYIFEKSGANVVHSQLSRAEIDTFCVFSSEAFLAIQGNNGNTTHILNINVNLSAAMKDSCLYLSTEYTNNHTDINVNKIKVHDIQFISSFG